MLLALMTVISKRSNYILDWLPMSSNSPRQRALAVSLLGLLIWSFAITSTAATLEQETATRIDQIRAIKSGQSHETMETYNRQMDAVWKFYASHKPEILPILRAQLKMEIAREHPSDLVLLDVGLFVQESDGAEGNALARDALFRLNPRAAIVNENYKELFELTHAVAADRDRRVLDFIDKNFLPTQQTIFISQHALKLDGTLMCVFLYGVFGTGPSAVKASRPIRCQTSPGTTGMAWLPQFSTPGGQRSHCCTWL